ncbi:MAG: Ig-like domain-containing protein [Candidatus Parvarchaeota archaeon]
MSNPVFAEVGGNAVQYYVAITITNSQSSATPSPFQQMITINSSNYSSYLASDLSNVNFQDGNGNILNSWLESGNSNTSTSTIYWVSLPNGVAANSSITIYYCTYATSVNAFNNTNTGVAPQLTSTYAQYDNGTNVFTAYANAGSSTPSTSTHVTYSATLPIVADGLTSFDVSEQDLGIEQGSYSWQTSIRGGPSSSIYMFVYQYDGSYTDGSLVTVNSSTQPLIETLILLNGEVVGYINYDSSNASTLSTSLPASTTTTIGNSGGPTYTYWVRARAYPPNGVMPSASIPITINYSSEAETYTILTQLNTPFQYSEAETYTMPTQIATPFQYSEAETYTMPTQIATPFQYTEAETYTILIQIATPFQYSEAETYTMPTQIATPFQYSEAETYTMPTQIATPFQYSEAETYTMPTQIDTPFQYSEAETEAQIGTTLTAGSLLIPITYPTEAETYTLSPYINTQISYSQTENYVMEALADVTFHYSEAETYAISLVYGVAPIIYNEQDSYFLIQNNQTSDASGNLINSIYLNIPFSQNGYISSIPISAYATYLPYKTNVQQVSTSMSSTIPFSFSYSLTTSANTSTYVITATVTDSAGTPIPGVVVNWSASGGTVSPTTSTTNSSGQATTTASGANVTVTASTTILGVTNTSQATS